MVKAINVVMYKADDGSVHATEAAAHWHNHQKRLALVHETLTDFLGVIATKDSLSSLSSSVFPYNWDEWEATSYERNCFMSDLFDLIINNWDRLKPLVDAYREQSNYQS